MQIGVWLQPGSPRRWGNFLCGLGPKVLVRTGSGWLSAQWQKWKEVAFEGWSRGTGKSGCNDAFWVVVRWSWSLLLISGFLIKFYSRRSTYSLINGRWEGCSLTFLVRYRLLWCFDGGYMIKCPKLLCFKEGSYICCAVNST